jgi:hypothetical protein
VVVTYEFTLQDERVKLHYTLEGGCWDDIVQALSSLLLDQAYWHARFITGGGYPVDLPHSVRLTVITWKMLGDHFKGILSGMPGCMKVSP